MLLYLLSLSHLLVLVHKTSPPFKHELWAEYIRAQLDYLYSEMNVV